MVFKVQVEKFMTEYIRGQTCLIPLLQLLYHFHSFSLLIFLSITSLSSLRCTYIGRIKFIFTYVKTFHGITSFIEKHKNWRLLHSMKDLTILISNFWIVQLFFLHLCYIFKTVINFLSQNNELCRLLNLFWSENKIIKEMDFHDIDRKSLRRLRKVMGEHPFMVKDHKKLNFSFSSLVGEYLSQILWFSQCISQFNSSLSL